MRDLSLIEAIVLQLVYRNAAVCREFETVGK